MSKGRERAGLRFAAPRKRSSSQNERQSQTLCDLSREKLRFPHAPVLSGFLAGVGFRDFVVRLVTVGKVVFTSIRFRNGPACVMTTSLYMLGVNKNNADFAVNININRR